MRYDSARVLGRQRRPEPDIGVILGEKSQDVKVRKDGPESQPSFPSHMQAKWC